MPHPPSPADVAAAVTRAKAEILDDIAAGVVPADVPTFSALHDHVDANVYGGLCDEGAVDWLSDVSGANAMQDTVDAWLRAGRPEDVQP